MLRRRIPISQLPEELKGEIEILLRNIRDLLTEEDPLLKLPENLAISIQDARRLLQSYEDFIRMEVEAEEVWSDVLSPISDAIETAGGYIEYDQDELEFLDDVKEHARKESKLTPADFVGIGWDGFAYYYVVRRGEHPDFDAVTDYMNSVDAMIPAMVRHWARAFTFLPPDKN